jgi:hypothetical protein
VDHAASAVFEVLINESLATIGHTGRAAIAISVDG